MRILVTGGAGFIGSALARQIINETDHSMINLDNLIHWGKRDSVAEVADLDP